MYGWLKTASDGKETMYRFDKPISAIRMNIVPKSEKQYLIDFWDRDVGTYNVNQIYLLFTPIIPPKNPNAMPTTIIIIL